MYRPDRTIVRPPWSAPHQECAGVRFEFRFKEQLGERRMSLIGTTVVQTYLGETRQLELMGPTAVIDHSHSAHLAICVRHDTNGQARFHVAISTSKLGPISMERKVVLINRPTQRLMTDGPDSVFGQITDVTELAPTIARGILAP